MTVSTTTSRADYTGNGATTAFAVPFYFLEDSHLTVLRTQISTGVITTLAITTNYTVSGAGNPAGGTVTCVVAPTADQKISILRNVPFTQLNTYVPNDPFPAASHERALDKLTMEVQQLDEAIDRALSLPANTPAGAVSAALPTPEANKFIAWNGSASGFQNLDASSLASVTAFATAFSDTFSGNGVQTAFALSAHPGSLANLRVSISGVVQRPTIDYTWVGGTTLTFTSAPAAGTNNILVQYATATPGALGFGTIASQDANNVAITGGSISSTTNISFTQSGTGAATRTVDAKLKDEVSLRDWGGTHDGQQFFGVAAMTSGSATLTVTGANFVAGDVGKLAYVRGAGAAGATLATTVSARVSATQLTLAASASTTVSNQDCIIATNNATEVNAADAVAGAKWVPEGLTGTNVAFNSLDGPYYGRGQIVDNLGNKHAPWIRRVTSPPALPANAPLHTDSTLTAFNGDISNVQIAMEHWVTGATTLGQPTTGYRHNPECSAVLVDLFNSSGYNHDNAGDIGRTMVNAFHVKVRQYGQGDIVPFLALGIAATNNSSATNWSAHPAVGAFAADLQAGIDHPYLNPVEINSTDNGYNCSAVGGVFNFFRTGSNGTTYFGAASISSGSTTLTVTGASFASPADVGKYVYVNGAGASGGVLATTISSVTNSTTVVLALAASATVSGSTVRVEGSQRHLFAGVRLNNQGSQFCDTGYSVMGKWRFGYDVSHAELDTDQAAITLKADQRIYGDVKSSDGAKRFPLALGSAYFTYSSSTSAWNLVASGNTVLNVNGGATFASASAFQPQLLCWNQTNDANGPYFFVRSSRGASGAGSASQVGDTLGTFIFAGHDTNGTSRNSAYMTSVALTVGTSSVTSYLQLNANGGNLTFGLGGANILDMSAPGEYRNNGTKVVGTRQTGWAAATGTATRTTFDTATVTTAQLAERVKALIDNLITHGLIGA